MKNTGTEKSRIKCTYCGAVGLNDSRTCGSCGAVFTEEQYRHIKQEIQKSRRIKLTLLAAAVLVAVTVSVLVVKLYVFSPEPDPVIVPSDDPYVKYIRIEERLFKKHENSIELGLVTTNTGNCTVQRLTLGIEVFNKSGEKIRSATSYVAERGLTPGETVGDMVNLHDVDPGDYATHRMVVQSVEVGTPSRGPLWNALPVIDEQEGTASGDFIRHEYRYAKIDTEGYPCVYIIARVYSIKGHGISRIGHVVRLYDADGNMIGENLKYSVYDSDTYVHYGPPVLPGERRSIQLVACPQQEYRHRKIARWKVFVKVLGLK